MDINRAKENLKGYLNWLKTNGFSMAKNDEAIQIILSELDKKDKIINKLLTEITAVNSGRYEYMDNNRVLEIFTNKVEEDIKE